MTQETHLQNALDHAWRYFELHAGQRMQSFNHFLTLSSVVVAALGSCVVSAQFRPFGIVPGVLLIVCAASFYFLDARTSFLIKHAESQLILLENQAPPAGQVVKREEEKTREGSPPTYGACFRTLFFTFGLVGILGTLFCAIVR
jgi:hypothetical protein